VLFVFVERWHEETYGFHLREVIVTHDDLSCLLHLSIEGRLLDHVKSLTKPDVVDLMELLGSDLGEVEYQVRKTKGSHSCFGWFGKFREASTESNWRWGTGWYRKDAGKARADLHIYLLYLVGVTLFTNKSTNYVNVTYMKYFWDLELVSDYS